MRYATVVASLLSCFAIFSTASQAEVSVGGYLMDSDAGTHPISTFPNLSSTPSRVIQGQDTQLRTPMHGSYEPTHELIYLSDFREQAIQVFPAFATGNVAPLRTIKSPLLGQPKGNVPIQAHGELAVISGCCIHTYPLQGNGTAVTPLRRLSWGGNSQTELDFPYSLIYVATSDEYGALTSSRTPPNPTYIVFHARTSQDDVPPTRRITGANVTNAVSLAHDAANGLIYVLRALGEDGRIDVFPDSASGDATPIRTIQGPQSQLHVTAPAYFAGMGYDPFRNNLMVTTTQQNAPSANRLVVLNANANGDTVPVNIIQGAVLSPSLVGTPFGVPASAPAGTPFVAIATPTHMVYGDTSALSTYGGIEFGTVRYNVITGNDKCQISGDGVLATGVGTCTVRARQTVNPFPPLTATVDLFIVPAQQAPLELIATPAQLFVGETSALSTQGGSGTGAVIYQISSGSEFCAVEDDELLALAPGVCMVHAYKQADPNHNSTLSAPVAVTVGASPVVFKNGFEAP